MSRLASLFGFDLLFGVFLNLFSSLSSKSKWNADLIHSNQGIFGYPDEHQSQGKRSFPLQTMAST
jgi:hypothetical protein